MYFSTLLLLGIGVVHTLVVNAAETVGFAEGDQTFSNDVLAGSFACAGDDCVPLSDQKLYTVSARDLVDETGPLADMPAEVKDALVQDVFGSRMITAIGSGVAPGGRYATHYAQVAVSKAQVANMDLTDTTCQMAYNGAYDSGGNPLVASPTSFSGRTHVCTTPATTTSYASFRCDGGVSTASRSCHKVSRNGFDIPVAPFTDLATTAAPAADRVARPYPFGPRTRTSLFTEASLLASSGTLSRTADNIRAAFCRFMSEAGASFTYDPDASDMANCFGYHQCDPDPASAADFQFASFQDTCFAPFTQFTTTYDSDGASIEAPNVAVHTLGPEPGTPTPGLWNIVGAGYESVLLETFPCDPDDGVSQNVLFAVDDSDEPLCLFDPAEKAAGGAGIHIVPKDSDQTMPPDAALQKVMFYSPVHRFIKEGGTWYQYTIRSTMLMHWGLLVGDLYGSANPSPDISFPLTDDFHVNLAYSWDAVAEAYVHPGCQAGRAEGEPCDFDIGMVMNTRYNALVFPCMDDGDGSCDWTEPNSVYNHVDAISLHGMMNNEYSTARFVTQISVSQLTVGGTISATTYVAGAALDIAVSSKTCHKYSTSEADVVFHMTLAGLDETFTISTNYVEYYHESADGTVSRVVFENDPVSCGDTARANSIPAGECYDVVSTQTTNGLAPESVAVSVRLPLSQCRDDFGATPGSCITKLAAWLAASSGSSDNRKIFVGYTMAFGDATTILSLAQGFVQRQELDCTDQNGICDALLRTDAVAALQQCESTTAVGGEVTITQVTNLVTKTLAVAVQPVFGEIDTRPPCKVLATGQVVCPALLHDQCEGNKGVASVQHLIAACGGKYSGANVRATNDLAAGGGDGGAAADPTCTTNPPGSVTRTVYTNNCRDHDSDEAACNVRYQPMFAHGDISNGIGKICVMNANGVWCQASTTCAVDSGVRRLQDLPSTTTPVTTGTPIKVLGNGLGYLHLGAAAGPQVQPATKMQQARQLVFPIGAKLTATCTDTDTETFSRPVIGGMDADGKWLVTNYEWVHVMGMDSRQFDAMKGSVESKAELVDAALVVADTAQILSRTNGIAVDSHAMFTKAQSHGCHPNDVKPFTYLGTERAQDHCDWVASATGSTNEYGDDCAEEINGGIDVQGLVAKGSTGSVVHGKPDASACNSGPAMVLGFNDQSPQYLADASLTAEAETVSAHHEGGNRNAADVSPQAPADCPTTEVDATCAPNDEGVPTGYRGFALAPMHVGLNGGNSFYSEFKGADTDDNQNRASVMAAFGVDINTAYLSQCGSGPTEWKLETQFFHADGITPIHGFFRRSLAATASLGALTSSTAHVRGDGPHGRSLQGEDAATNQTNQTVTGATVSAISQSTALSCMDTSSRASGVFDTACICDDRSVLPSKQCQMAFAPPPTPPPEDDDDDDDSSSSSSAWIWIVLVAGVGALCFVHKRAKEDTVVTRSIEKEYREKLLTR